MPENTNATAEITYKPTKKKGGRTHQFAVFSDGAQVGTLTWKRTKGGSTWVYVPADEDAAPHDYPNLKAAHAGIPEIVTKPEPKAEEDPAPEGEEPAEKPEAQPKAAPKGKGKGKSKPAAPKTHMLEEFGDVDTFLTAILTVRQKGRNAVTAGDWETTAPEGEGEYNIVKVDRGAGRVTISTPSGKYPATPNDGAGFQVKKAGMAAGPKTPVSKPKPKSKSKPEPEAGDDAPKPTKSTRPRKSGLFHGDFKVDGLKFPKGATEAQQETIHWLLNRMSALDCFCMGISEVTKPTKHSMALDDADGSITVAMTMKNGKKGKEASSIQQSFMVMANGSCLTPYTTRYGKDRIAKSRGWVLKARLTAQDTPLDKKEIGAVNKWIIANAE